MSSAKDTYRGNAEHKLSEIKDQVAMIKRQVERGSLTEVQLKQRLDSLLKDLDQTTFLLSLT
jgi:hypothetical protein